MIAAILKPAILKWDTAILDSKKTCYLIWDSDSKT